MNDATTLQDDELLIERILDAPPELVFKVWTAPEHLVRWWGPKDFTTIAFEQDFRPGGAWRAGIRDPSGGEHWMSGTYREIDADARIVTSFSWDDGAWGLKDSVITVSFARLAGGRTHFRFHQAPFPDVATRDAHTGGWTELVDKLSAYLSEESAR